MNFDPSTAEAVGTEPTAFDPSTATPEDSTPHWQKMYAGNQAAMESLDLARRDHVENMGKKTPDSETAFFSAVNRAFIGSKLPLFQNQPDMDMEAAQQAFAGAYLGQNVKGHSPEAFYKLVAESIAAGKVDAAEKSIAYENALANAKKPGAGPIEGLKLYWQYLLKFGPERSKVPDNWGQKGIPVGKIMRKLGVPDAKTETGLPDMSEAAPQEPKSMAPRNTVPYVFEWSPTGDNRKQLFDPEISQGVYNTLTGASESFTTPENLSLMAITGGASTLKNTYTEANLLLKGMTMTFSGVMAKQAYETSDAVKKVLSDPHATHTEKVQAVTESILTDMLAIGATFAAAHENLPAKIKPQADAMIKGRTPGEVAPILRQLEQMHEGESSKIFGNAAKALESISPPAEQAGSKGPAPATFHGIQEGIPGVFPDIELYNLHDGIEGHPAGSTVSRQTLERKGYTVPPIEATAQTAPSMVGGAIEPRKEALFGKEAVKAEEEPVNIGKRPTEEEQSALNKKVEAEQKRLVAEYATGISNASVDEQIKAMGLDPIAHGASVTDKELLDGAVKAIMNDEKSGEKLIANLEQSKRPPTKEEAMLLSVESNRLSRIRDKSEIDLIISRQKGDTIETARAELAVQKARDDYVRAASLDTLIGTEQAQAFRIRGLRLKEDYSLAAMEQRRMAANPQGELTPEAQKEVAELKAAYDKTLKDFDDYRSRMSELLMSDESAPARRGAPPGKVMGFISEQAKAARERIKARMAEGRLQAGLDPVDLADHAIIGAEVIAKGITKFADWGKAMVKEFGERLTPHLAAIYDSAKEIVTTRRRLVAAEAAADRQIKVLEEQIKNEAPFSATKTEGPKNAAIEAKRAKVKELQEIRDNLRDMLQTPPDPEPPREPKEKPPAKTKLQIWKERTAKRLDELQGKLAMEDFEKKTRQPLPLDDEALRLKASHERVKRLIELAEHRDALANESTFDKIRRNFQRWVRFGALSYPSVIAKLTTAAMGRFVFYPIEQGVGLLQQKFLPESLTSKGRFEAVPTLGGFMKSEARAVKEALTTGIAEAGRLLANKETNLSVLMDGEHYPSGVLEYMGKIHEALKTPAKIADYNRRLSLIIDQDAASGINVNHPTEQLRMMHEAYNYSKRSIFMQDNGIVNAYKSAIRSLEAKQKASGERSIALRLFSSGIQSELPIIKVPTNVVAEISEYVTGILQAPARLAWQYAKGIDGLTTFEADTILRQFKKGAVGAGFLLLGYYKYENVGGFYEKGEKRKPGEVQPMKIKIGGRQVPKQLLDSPLFDVMQYGATLGRVSDELIKGSGGKKKGPIRGLFAASIGLIEEVPFIRETAEFNKFTNWNGAIDSANAKAASLLVPGFVQWFAAQTDKKTPFDQFEDPTRRKATNLKEAVEKNIPGFRKNVPAVGRDPNTSFRK